MSGLAGRRHRHQSFPVHQSNVCGELIGILDFARDGNRLAAEL